MIAGSFSGFILSPVKNPFEVIRIQLQTHCKTEIKGPVFEFFRRKGKSMDISNQFIIDLISGGLAGSTSWFHYKFLNII